MTDSVSLPNDLSEFIASAPWRLAKTMPRWPHEYIVRGCVDERLFVKLVCHIRTNGYQGTFYNKVLTYFDADGMLYWTMGAPLEETVIINRCRKEDSYEYRLRNGTLPAQSSNRPEHTRPADADDPPAR